MPKIQQNREFYVGIDPGKQGGIATIDSEGKIFHYWEMPDSDYDLLKLFNTLSLQTKFCYLEQVATRPGEGHVGAFTFGEGYGKLQIALAANDLSYEKIPPREWMKVLRIRAKAKTESRPQFKERLRQHCQQLFPKLEVWSGTLKVQRAVCDALLIAEACRRVKEGVRL